MNIGLLEDNPAICEYITLALELIGHKVCAHATGASFLEALSSDSEMTVLPYDLAIVDLHLPGKLSGQDVVANIRSTASSKRLPIIITTGAGEREIAHVKARFPSIPILHKPFRLQNLVKFIDQYCGVSSSTLLNTYSFNLTQA